MNTLYTEQLNDMEDVVLDNYIALLRHAIGDERLRVISSVTNTGRKLPLELKELWRKELRTCQLCGIVKFYPYHYSQRYCGNRIKKEGCAYKRGQEGIKKSFISRKANMLNR